MDRGKRSRMLWQWLVVVVDGGTEGRAGAVIVIGRISVRNPGSWPLIMETGSYINEQLRYRLIHETRDPPIVSGLP